MYKKGSITVYLSLILVVLLSLFAAALYSGQAAGARMQAVHAADQGMYSLFSRYHIPLLEHYHLFFIDGTFGEGTLNMSRVYEILEDDTSIVLQNVKKDKLIDELKLENGSVTGYTLAADNAGNAVKSQAVSYMETVLGIQGVRSLIERVKAEEETIEVIEDSQDVPEEEEIFNIYDSVKSNDEESEVTEETLQEEVVIPENYVNPVEAVEKASSQGILKLVLPNENGLSTAYLSSSKMISNRTISQGMGIPAYDDSCDSWSSELLFGEYLLRHFGCYTDSVQSEGLQYQLEYMIHGKESDIENLKGVVNRLLAIREAANLQYLYQDASKRALIKSASAVLAAVCMAPEAASVLEPVLMFCWAFGESILDIRCLLEGGKVPLQKDSSSWKLALSNLQEILQGGGHVQSTDDHGMTYQEYLRVLLLTINAEKKVYRAMDMIEAGIRSEEGNQGFRLDACIYTMEAQFSFQTSRNLTYDVLRSYGYDME